MLRRSGEQARRGGPAARFVAVLAASLLALAALAGCSTSPYSEGPHFVTPPLIRYSSVLWPVPLELVGAEPGATLRLRSSLSTSRGVWSSAATYQVPASGILDMATARPQLAPYAQPDSAGLFWSLRGPQLSPSDQVRQWMTSTVTLTLSAWDGARLVAERTFRLQGLAADLHPRTVRTRDLLGDAPGMLPPQTHEDGPVGTFWSAASLERPATPAVVMFDDPSAGASSAYTAPLLAEFGASVFVVPLAGARDGVRLTGAIDDSTVEAVLAWLQERPDVLSRRVFVYGTGAAGAVAVWAATHFASRIAGLFEAGGTPVVLCSPDGGASPIREGGVPVPCNGATEPVSRAFARSIDVVRGPVVLACGGRDAVLPSACAWQEALAETRAHRASDSVQEAAVAGHAVSVPPGLPIALDTGGAAGFSPQATEKARVAFWNAVGQIILRAAIS
ncbi:acyl-CoA thioesterase/BAAT N-terminal domain-containing protein [Leifsonia sp. AG29]|uniref:acyl-CoA thioesterase/BAAT N-terminal domain-containing protein n=1 Tax=Leifsonia sp. AG29 TaxID=2598860 RepID=UPI00131BC6C6|nr:acyl-CoA thioesterase/BAAT N-terminal domain-containing protein [Leifsonia sp. AG29]